MDFSRIKDTKDLQALLELMGKYDLVELEITRDGQSVRLRKADGVVREVVAAPLHHAGLVPAQPATTSPGSVESVEPALPANVQEVPSPMVGTFYRAPSPEADPFVMEGDRVEVDSPLCIIEAMKVMNEIPAGIAGIVRDVLIKNGESVEFGQPLVRIEVE